MLVFDLASFLDKLVDADFRGVDFLGGRLILDGGMVGTGTPGKHVGYVHESSVYNRGELNARESQDGLLHRSGVVHPVGQNRKVLDQKKIRTQGSVVTRVEVEPRWWGS